MKIQVIDDVKGTWKLLSVKVMAFWSLLGAALVGFPDVLSMVWNAMPVEVQSLFPPWVRGVIALVIVFGTWYAARIVKQPVTDAGKVAEVAAKTDIAPEVLKTLSRDELDKVGTNSLNASPPTIDPTTLRTYIGVKPQ